MSDRDLLRAIAARITAYFDHCLYVGPDPGNEEAVSLLNDIGGSIAHALGPDGGLEEWTFDYATGTLSLDRFPPPQETIAAVRAELRKPCPHGIPKSDPCAECAQRVPF
jgi:hypothetical protein